MTRIEIDGSSKSSVNDGIAEALAGEIEPKAEKEYASSMFEIGRAHV